MDGCMVWKRERRIGAIEPSRARISPPVWLGKWYRRPASEARLQTRVRPACSLLEEQRRDHIAKKEINAKTHYFSCVERPESRV